MLLIKTRSTSRIRPATSSSSKKVSMLLFALRLFVRCSLRLVAYVVVAGFVEAVDVQNPGYDYIPPEYVTLFVTNL